MTASEIFRDVLALAKTDEAKALLPALATFFTSVAGNPTAVNLVAQATQLQVAFLAAQPGIAQDVLKEIAGYVNTEAQALLTAPHAS